MSFSAGRKIIFDMDGVITSEERYWDAAALTVWELLFSGNYLGLKPLAMLPPFKTDPSAQEIASVRRVVFCEDKVISFFKRQAVNSNWDLAFLTFAFQFVSLLCDLDSRGIVFAGGDGIEIAETKGITAAKLSLIRSFLALDRWDGWEPSFESVLGGWPQEAKGAGLAAELCKLLPSRYAQILGDCSSASLSPLWNGVREIFQQWYLGEERFAKLFGKKEEASGKEGLICREEPIIEISRLKETLSRLKVLGWELGIATGRPLSELLYPLEQMDMWQYFQPDSVVTYDEVAKAEKMLRGDLPRISLGKPHPFSFLKAYWGKEKSDRQLAADRPPLPQRRMCWIVGDAMADLLAARDAGACFIGVLTGQNGAGNKEIFAREGAGAVLPDITSLPDFIARYA